MAPKPWADTQRLAWLHLQLPDYIRRHAEGKLHLFWGVTEEAWFARFPEQEQLGLPLPNDASAPVLTREQVGQLGAAITTRKGVSRSRTDWNARALIAMIATGELVQA